MRASRRTLVLLLVWVAFTFSSCTALTGSFASTVPYLIWVGCMLALFFANRKVEFMAWPIEFMLWTAILLVFVNLLWLRFA
jgi:hypothetical protein